MNVTSSMNSQNEANLPDSFDVNSRLIWRPLRYKGDEENPFCPLAVLIVSLVSTESKSQFDATYSSRAQST